MTGIATELRHPKEGDTSSVEFQYVKADFIAAYQLFAAPTRRRWILLLMSALVLAAAIFMYSREVSQTIVAFIIISVGGALGTLAEFYAYFPWRARRDWAKSPLSHLEYKFTLLSDGITLQNPRGISRLQWNDFLRWRTNGKTTLIFLSPTTYLHFPARLAELGFPMDRMKVELVRALGPPS
jgi:YcxB-like protein